MEFFSYKNQYVRDLVWALESPPLMRFESAPCQWFQDDWYRQIYHESSDWLRELDEDQTALASMIEAEKDQRLGRYYELLWSFWFEHSDRFEILGRNLQIEYDGRTQGELDLVVHEHATGRNIHIELAVKFYLGIGDTRYRRNWYGTNKRDRLDIKIDALLKRQSVLTHQMQVEQVLAERGIHVDSCAVILKGRLFYPGQSNDHAAMPEGSNPEHQKCYWLNYHQLDQLECMDYIPLQRRGWLAGCDPRTGVDVYTISDIKQALNEGGLKLPLYLTGYRKHEEKIRLFVVPDDWSTTL